MTKFNKKTAVILFNLGGPDSLDSVKPFLFNLFNDKAIISLPQPFRFLLAKFISKKREKTAQEIYSHLGGKSPILDLTTHQAEELEKELSFHGNFKCFIAMRYAPPFADEVIADLKKYRPDEVILLPLYPQFSSTTSASSLKEFKEKFTQKFPSPPKVKTICCYPEEEDFIKSHAHLLKKTIRDHVDGDFNKFRFLFSAHGLPQKIVDAGDPYVFQAHKTTEKIIKNFASLVNIEEQEIEQKLDYKLCFQSKVGPLKWTTPSLDSEINRAAIDKKIPVILPVAFVCEHSETLVELDIEYKEMAEKLGIKEYYRVPALNSEGHFIKSLTKICAKVSKSKEDYFSADKNIRICPNKFTFCTNPNPCK